MEQLINAGTRSTVMFIVFIFIAGAILIFNTIAFIIKCLVNEYTPMELKRFSIIFTIGLIMLIPSCQSFKSSKNYSQQAEAIAQKVIAEHYPDATNFDYFLNEGSFKDNGIDYSIDYEKTISNKEYLIVSIINKDNTRGKEVNKCNIPKKWIGEENNGTTN